LYAGKTPNTTPINNENVNDNMITGNENEIVVPEIDEYNFALINPIPTPIIPPNELNTIDSIKNWSKISNF
jgi:hypothetical protein